MMKKMKSLLAGIALAALAVAPCFGQGAGELGSGQMLANPTANPSRGQATGASAYFDFVYGSTRGAILERGASGWQKVNPSATAGLPWVSAGTGADPLYGQVALAGLPTIGANTVLGSIAGGTPIALSQAQLTSLVNLFSSSLPGAVSSPGSPTGKFLRDDDTWQAVVGSGTVTQIVCDGVTITTTGTCPPHYGFANCSLAASVGSNLLTVALKDNAGSDPSATSPCTLWFRNATVATGSWTQVIVTSALSISTNATGATLGTANGVPFRIWVTIFNNAGTPVLALWQSVTGGGSPTGIAGLNEAGVAATTGISGSATSAGTFYTPNGTSLTSKAFLILGYVEYATGLTTAGTYASGPTTIQTFGPGIKKPGDILQTVYSTATTASSLVTSASFTTVFSANITPSSSPNIIRAHTSGSANIVTGLNVGSVAIARGTATPFASSPARNSTASALYVGMAALGWDAPGTTSLTTYNVRIRGDGTNGIQFPVVGSSPDNATLELQEIMD